MILPSINYLKRNNPIKVLCPFDTKESAFVDLLSKMPDVSVQYSHLTLGDSQKDFFSYSIEELRKFDLILSNPPFSKKMEIFERLMQAEVPWAMVMNFMAIGYVCMGDLFLKYERNPQILFPTKHISYDGHNCMFASVFIGEKFLESDFQYVFAPDDNAGDKFEGSKMGAPSGFVSNGFNFGR
jgi:hypothetical protein